MILRQALNQMAGRRLPLCGTSSSARPPSSLERPLSLTLCRGIQAGKAGSPPAQRLCHRRDGGSQAGCLDLLFVHPADSLQNRMGKAYIQNIW